MKKVMLMAVVAAGLANVALANITIVKGDMSAYDKFDETLFFMWTPPGSTCSGFEVPTTGPIDMSKLDAVLNADSPVDPQGVNPNLLIASKYGWTTNVRQCLDPPYSSVHELDFNFYKDGKLAKSCDLTDKIADAKSSQTITIPDDCPQS